MLIYGELQQATFENLSADPGGTAAGRVWNNTTEGRVKSDDGTLKRAFLKNDQHLVIGNSGTASDNLRLHRGAVDVLQFLKANDVTAEGTLSTNLGQISARLENYTDAGLPAFGNIGRLAYITDTTSFAFDTGAAWDKIRLLRPQIAQATITRTFAAQGAAPAVGNGSSFCDTSGGAFSLTLPSAVGANGEELIFQKTDSSFNPLTLTGVTTLNTQNESVVLRSNNVVWLVERRYIPSVTITATFGVSGGLAATGPASQNSFLRRVGDRLIGEIYFVLGNTAAGQGNLTFPAGIALDPAKFTDNKTQLGDWFVNELNNKYATTNRMGKLFGVAASPGQLFVANNGIAASATALSINTTFGGGSGFAAKIDIPVLGWNG